MKDIITNREDLFLAKVAGRDVDITTMTPPVPTNMHEKLMLEVAERIDNAGGGGPITVDTEITEGGTNPVTGGAIYTALNAVNNDFPVTFTGSDGKYTTETTISDILAAVNDNKRVFAVLPIMGGSVEVPLMFSNSNNGVVVFTTVGIHSDGGLTPGFAVLFGGADEGAEEWIYISPEENDADFVVTFAVSFDGGTPTITAVRDADGNDLSVAEILAAKASGRNVVGIADIGAYIQEFPLTAYGPGLNNEGLVAFGAVLPDSGDQKTSNFAVQGDVVVDGDTKNDRWQLFIG